MSSPYEISNPYDRFPRPPFPAQSQDVPGDSRQLDPTPDHGESSYVGTGRLPGAKALVTGGDSGIGRAVAIAFAREGADVALVHLPSEQEEADEVVALVQKEGRTAVSIAGDITDEAFCRSAVQQAVQALGGLTCLVNNAGRQQANEDFSTLTTADFDATYKTNVYAMFWFSQEALAHLRPGSSIINTSSIQAYNPAPFLVDYASTKAAINNFSKALAGQLVEKGIRVNVVAPGPVWTPLQTSGGQLQENIPDFGSETPLGRPAQPVELAPLFVFLASQESSYVTGATISAVGGVPTP